MADEVLVPERAGLSRAAKTLLAFALVLVLLIALFFMAGRTLDSVFGKGPPPESVVESSLRGLKEQNVLVPFSAQFVSVATSKQSRLGLSAKKTLILPGLVRYELDLSKLDKDSIDWDAPNNRLTITLPPITIAGPEVDLRRVREYGEGGILMALTDAEATLDDANLNAARLDLLNQAKSGPTMNLAREAARKAVESNFQAPLRAMKIDADVIVRFADEVKE